MNSKRKRIKQGFAVSSTSSLSTSLSQVLSIKDGDLVNQLKTSSASALASFLSFSQFFLQLFLYVVVIQHALKSDIKQPYRSEESGFK